MNKVLLPIALAAVTTLSHAESQPGPDSVFPNARPGECYAKVFYAPTYAQESQQVLKSAAYTVSHIVPAQFEAGEEEVVVREASKRLEVVPATYKTVEETIEVRPASKRLERVPGTTETVSEQVLVQAARTVWKKGANPYGAVSTKRDASGEILCLVEIPAVYKTVTHTVRKPDTFREVEIPAVTKTVQRTVVDQPATTREVEIPAVTKMVKVTKEVAPAREEKSEVPAEYQTVTSTKQTAPGRYEWRSILCETNATHDKVREIQTALKGQGFDPGPIDGVIKSLTMGALNRFRQAKSLPTDDYVTLDTLAALGVQPK
jgi:hypothetical protein